MLPPRGLGALFSALDYRDGYATAAATPALTAATISPTKAPAALGGVLDQNLIPACVAHAVTKLIKRYWYRKRGVWLDLSPRFLDVLSMPPGWALDSGRDPREVLKLAASVGVCTTKLLPNDTGLPLAQYRNPALITDAMRAEAAQYKIPGFIGIPKDLVRQAIYLYDAVTTTFIIGNELWTPSWLDKDIDPLRPPKQIVGGHQMDPNGYETALINVENEWGPEWANKGANRYDPTAWAPFTFNSWAIAELPSDLVTFLKHLPAPADFHFHFEHNMAQGDESEDVKWAQVAYMILGYLAPVPPEELGYFGNKTAKANALFQAASGIAPVPSAIGRLTRTALNTRFAV